MKTGLDKIFETLEKHSRILEEHTKILEAHSKALARIDASIESLGRGWEWILRELFLIYKEGLGGMGIEPGMLRRSRLG